jgi:aspartate/methionine/tyrosine aminotransferase
MGLPFLLTKLLVRTGLARYLPAADRLSAGGRDHLHYYSDRLLAAPVADLLDPGVWPPAPGADAINLNLSAPAFDSPVTGGRVAADRQGLPPPQGLSVLRQAVADAARRDGREVDPRDGVLVTHGATGAFAAALDAFVHPGRAVVLFDPCSPLFRIGATARRARLRWVPSRLEEGRLAFDPDTLSRALRGATLLALSDPGTPLGGSISDVDLERIAWAADRSDVLLYLDESFARYRAGGPSRLPKLAAGRTLVAGSITPSDGLGSVRVGWLSGPKQLVRACAVTASLSAPFVPTICQNIALRAVTADDDLYGPAVEEVRDRVRYTAGRLRDIGFEVSEPAGGYFFWLPTAPLGLAGRTFAARLFAEQKVTVGPGDVYGPSGGGFVRLSAAAEDGRLREGLARLGAFVAGLTGRKPEPRETKAVAEDRQPVFSRA